MIQKEMQLDNTVIYDLSAGECHARGLAVNIPDTELNILQARCKNGMLFCGIFSKEVLEKLDFPAAVVSAPAVADMMERKPVFLTSKAMAMGATMNMTGEELLVLFS